MIVQIADVENDLGANYRNMESVKALLVKQGVKNIKKISLYE